MVREVARRVEAGVFGPEARLYSGRWIRFHDRNGPGYAQPDCFVLTPERVYLIEAKLTQTQWAVSQMKELYEPLLWQILRRPIACVAAFHNLWNEPLRMIECPSQARPGPVFTWHWTR